MKKLLPLIALLTSVAVNAQTPYTTTADANHPGGKILNGIVTKYALSNDTAFKWYAMNKNAYKPDSSVLNSMEASKGKYQFVLFGGSWCEDTQFILPKFFMLQELAGVADKDISFFAVDRAKQTIGGITAAFKITNVPTIIVMKDGKEVGRVVEYGKTGKWDKELSELMP
ncbi:MAG: thioredoxin [Pedobacter sp.]|nr:MAG: thioredoxin [Pedobacter sp.]